jgi:hypothetical protein
MGVYNNGKIYGIRIYNFNDDDLINILFEEKYDEIMSHEQMKQAYLFYNELNDKNDIHFNFLTECISTCDILDKENFMMWYPMSLNQFLENCNV